MWTLNSRGNLFRVEDKSRQDYEVAFSARLSDLCLLLILCVLGYALQGVHHRLLRYRQLCV
jgi:hypothetical protein